jgi:sugar lactone lactonase YvrE
MVPTVWDQRKCHVGEGPTPSGADNSLIYWVDILNNRVHFRDLYSEVFGEIATDENVSFVLPTPHNELLLGTANGPELLQSDQTVVRLPGRYEVDGKVDAIPMRWNDAKVGPGGEVWITTSAYGAKSDDVGLHRLSPDGRSIKRVLSGMSLSNGLDWNPDASTFYLIDTVELALYAFDYHDGEISNQRTAISFDADANEYPDGMCVDSEGFLWIAFWNGACIRRYSPDFQSVAQIDFPVRFVSSCTFAGKDFSTLVVTTATGDNGWHDDHEYAGMTFLVETDVKGKAPYVLQY